MRGQSAQFNLDGNGVALLLAELDHRIRNLLTTIEAAVKQTHSTTVEDYRAKLIARITSLYNFCEFTSRYSHAPSASSGRVRPVAGAPRELAIVWVEHGGPEVKWAACRLRVTARQDSTRYGGARLDLNNTGLGCFMVVDLDRPDARLEERSGTSRKCGSKPHSHSTRH